MNDIVPKLMSGRFRGYLPVVVDLETGGFNARTDALLEIAAVTLTMDEQGNLLPDETFSFHIEPFEGANIEQSALDFTGIRLDSASERSAQGKGSARGDLSPDSQGAQVSPVQPRHSGRS